MTFESVGMRKCNKMIILLICLLLSCCGCSDNVEEDNYDEWVYQQVQEELKRDQHYTIYENNDGTYLFEVYNSEGNVVWRDILYDEPTIQLYDSRYIEVQWGAGTGLWMNRYYDLETCFITQPIECARYIENGIVAIVVDGEKRVLRLWNPFSYGNYLQDIEMDFNTEMANPSDCIIQLTKKEEMELLVEYWNEDGEKATTKICMEPDLYDYEDCVSDYLKQLGSDTHMNFEDIMNVMGNTDISQSGINIYDCLLQRIEQEDLVTVDIHYPQIRFMMEEDKREIENRINKQIFDYVMRDEYFGWLDSRYNSSLYYDICYVGEDYLSIVFEGYEDEYNHPKAPSALNFDLHTGELVGLEDIISCAELDKLITECPERIIEEEGMKIVGGKAGAIEYLSNYLQTENHIYDFVVTPKGIKIIVLSEMDDRHYYFSEIELGD